ncbi:phosphoesterase PA-phosphatase related protein [Oscillatoria nigro-viridis PCC 7112]|uniref:Phosphoesterase PA-phosphatase related protein n=1 Tax=Phormidium nigroviride PCC 7112 TaxID=179408 RepID=K9VHB5_9CYAN|nr:phosphatase PAP2 family protein [Oscillatoria nigro-viridis]AFZ06919.1 phosphoesterase PA-phosphatase related protein [Oscillatoria nigro-viridis PCC 7112]
MASLTPSPQFDYLEGTTQADKFNGLDGNDIIYAKSGDDYLEGDAGKDKICGDQGNDTIVGGDDDDILWGGKGSDLIAGDSGNDLIYAGAGSDTVSGGTGDDIFAIAKGSGGPTVATADYIADFGNGNDKIRLLDGLTFEDLNIQPGTNPNSTVIQDKLTGEYLAVLQGVNSDTINRNNFTTQISGNAVLDWNTTLLDAVRTASTAPPLASRNMAMVHAAIYDSVNSISKKYSPYRVSIDAPAGASEEAATAAAAHRTLVSLYPAQAGKFDAALQSSLAKIPDGKAKQDGIALGQQVADQIISLRSTDGITKVVQYTPKTEPGSWVPTPPALAAALAPQWGEVTPFAMTSGSQFRPSGPPALDSAKYAEEVNYVKEIGKSDSLTRTPDQTAIAKFWANGAGTFTPPGHWNQIAQDASALAGNSLEDNARLFALLNIAEADAAISCWDAKFQYNSWRPVTAIRQADTDNNPNTTADPQWTPLLTTPPFPEYTSGHSTFSGAADAVMSSVFGSDFGFGDKGDPSVNTLRTYENFTEAADESGMSRLYGGIHFMSANLNGLSAGRNVGNYVVQNFLV